MAVLGINDIFFTPFEPKVQNRFIFSITGIPAFMIKGLSAVGFDQGEIKLNHINI